MGRLWSSVEHAAAAEFGRRHYRGIIGLRIARHAAVPTLMAATGVALVAAVVLWVIPAVAHGAPAAAAWSTNLLPALVVLGIAVVVVPVALLAWRAWGWRLEYRAPWLTGRVASACGSLVLVAAVALVVWPR